MKIEEAARKKITKMIESFMICVRNEKSSNKEIKMYAESLVEDMELVLDIESVVRLGKERNPDV